MNMQQCPNGHFYDMSKSAQCPYCSGNVNIEREGGTVSLDPTGANRAPAGFGAYGQNMPPTSAMPGNVLDPAAGSMGPGSTVAVVTPVSHEGVTVAIPKKVMGINPVVGWLVCVNGKVRGQDYRIRGGNNRIGSSGDMNIQIVGDDTISRVDMAFIIYEPIKRTFLVTAGHGANLVYVNDELLPVSSSRKLEAYDKILLGETTLMFVPLCGEAFAWE